MLEKKNFAKSSLASGITAGATQLTVSPGEGTKFPPGGKFRAVLWGAACTNPSDDPNSEIVEAALNAGDTFDIARGKEGTSGRAWSAGDNLTHVLTAETLKEVEDLAVRGASRGLVIKNNASNPDYQLDIDADEIVLHNSSGSPFKATAVDLTADITASGANGLDTGSEASNTWYYAWVISDGVTVTALLSTSLTSPTMPAGYTFKALAGAMRNDGSGNFITLYQIGKRAAVAEQVVCNNQQGVTSWTQIDIAAFVPGCIEAFFGNFGDSAAASRGIAVASDINGLGAVWQSSISANDGPWSGWQQVQCFELLAKEAQKMYWLAQDTGSSYRITITGFRMK